MFFKGKLSKFNYCDKFNKFDLLVVHVRAFNVYFQTYIEIIVGDFFQKVGRWKIFPLVYKNLKIILEGELVG